MGEPYYASYERDVNETTHDFTIEAIHKGKNVLRCRRRFCLVIWYDGKKMPTSRCRGKEDR